MQRRHMAQPGAGARLRAWRTQRKVSAAALADYLGVSERSIHYWEAEQRSIQHEEMLNLALRHFDCAQRF
jgi:transcriptional regulator with XRE-family HTH domain